MMSATFEASATGALTGAIVYGLAKRYGINPPKKPGVIFAVIGIALSIFGAMVRHPSWGLNGDKNITSLKRVVVGGLVGFSIIPVILVALACCGMLKSK